MISPPMDSFSDDEPVWSLPGRLAAWPQPKNFVARPSVKSLIEHSCSKTTEPPAPLDDVILAIHQRGLKEVAEAREKVEKVGAEVTKVEKQLVEGEESLKKNK